MCMKKLLSIVLVLISLPLLAQKNRVPDWFFNHADDQVVGVSLPGMSDRPQEALHLAISQALTEYLYAEELGDDIKPNAVSSAYSSEDSSSKKITTQSQGSVRMVRTRMLLMEVLKTYTNRCGEVFVLLRMNQGEQYKVKFAMECYHELIEVREVDFQSEMDDRTFIQQQKVAFELLGNDMGFLISLSADRIEKGNDSDLSVSLQCSDKQGAVFEKEWDDLLTQEIEYKNAGVSEDPLSVGFATRCEAGLYMASIDALFNAMEASRIDTKVGIQSGYLLMRSTYKEQPSL